MLFPEEKSPKTFQTKTDPQLSPPPLVGNNILLFCSCAGSICMNSRRPVQCVTPKASSGYWLGSLEHSGILGNSKVTVTS